MKGLVMLKAALPCLFPIHLDVVNLGDTLDVKYFGVDPRTRKDKVSRKALLPKPEGYVDKPRKTFNRNNNRKGFNKK